MVEVAIEEIGGELAKYLPAIENGETVVVTSGGKPVAEVRRYVFGRRPIGLASDQIRMGPEFFEPLPPDFLAAFNGEEPPESGEK